MGSTRFALLIFAWFTIAGGAFYAHARLGEARGELTVAEGRYGAPTGESTPVLQGSLEKVDLFEKDGIGITVEYAADGKVWRITFNKKDLSEKLIENLLQKNSGEHKWSKAVNYRDNKHWVTDDKQLHAVYYGTPIYDLIIMTDAAAKAERLVQTIEGRETKRVSESKGGVIEEKKTTDPLEGF